MADEPSTDPTANETERVKASLRRLAGPADSDVIEQAVAAVDDLQAAVGFVETVGMAELERAVESVDDPATRERGTRALAAFRRYRRAATSEHHQSDHFHSHYRSDLTGGAQGPSR